MFDETIREHYRTGYERERLTVGSSRIEFARTNELLQRFLPSAPATILDVGGGPGAYAAWLADQGYQVHLVDPLPLHVEQAAAAARARDRSFTVALGDARSLAQNDSSCDAVLILGPLYHITDRAERVRALAEAKLAQRSRIRRNRRARSCTGAAPDPTSRPEWFTTAFFHDPDDLRTEVEEAGLQFEALFGIEGPGWLLWHQWDEPQGREDILYAAGAVEQEKSLIGASAHLLVMARDPR
jgi:SAM-dependent methyltransferase